MVIVYKNPYLNHMTTGSYWVVNLRPPPQAYSFLREHTCSGCGCFQGLEFEELWPWRPHKPP